MTKQQQLMELRDELAAVYQKELGNIQKLLDSGIERIANDQADVTLKPQESLAICGEAGQIFCDEFGDAALLALERYERNLRKEMVSLGLDYGNDATRQGDIEASVQRDVERPSDHRNGSS